MIRPKSIGEATRIIHQLQKQLEAVVATAKNRKIRLQELQKENDELRNRRD